MIKELPFRYILHILLCLGILSATSPEAARSRYWPTGIQLSMDVVNPLYYKYYQKQLSQQYEFNASIDCARILLEGDYGWGSLANGQTNPTASGRNRQYFRVGLNYNLLPDTPNRNAAFLGARYAHSFLQASSGAKELAASWYEVVAGVKVKVWTIFYVGGTVRYKLGLSPDKDLGPQHLLGWGSYKKGDDERLGISYYVSLRIPFEGYQAPQKNSPKK